MSTVAQACNSPSGFKREAPEGCCWRLGAPSRRHTDRGVHVSSSLVMATPAKSGNSSPTHCSVAGSVELGELGTPPSWITQERPPCPQRLWPWCCRQCNPNKKPRIGGAGRTTRAMKLRQPALRRLQPCELRNPRLCLQHRSCGRTKRRDRRIPSVKRRWS